MAQLWPVGYPKRIMMKIACKDAFQKWLHALTIAGVLAFLFATSSTVLGIHVEAIAASAKSSAGDWTTYLFDRNHDGYNPYESIINPVSAGHLKQHWKIKAS